MSLKGFHIFFIFLSVLLAAGFALWSFANAMPVPFGIGACVIAVGLTIYGFYFIRKSRQLIV